VPLDIYFFKLKGLSPLNLKESFLQRPPQLLIKPKQKCFKTPRNNFLNKKGQGPLNLKNKCAAAQWEIISY
jgi:hypothetical protein